MAKKKHENELWDMRYLENYIAEFSEYYYKIGHNETNTTKTPRITDGKSDGSFAGREKSDNPTEK